MNQNHAIDYRRPYANEYAKMRTDVRFWHGLRAPTQQAIALFFSDSNLLAKHIEQQVGASSGSLRKALRNRGLHDENSSPSRTSFGYHGPRGSAYSPANESPVEPQRPDPVAVLPPATTHSLLDSLKHAQEEISAKMRALSAEWDKLQAAIVALS